jgi:hypothetical protein
MSVAVLSDRLGTCLASAPLIGLMLSLVAGQQGDVLFISRWWDVWSVLRWPRKTSTPKAPGRRVMVREDGEYDAR